VFPLLETAPDRLARDHLVDREMLAHVTQELDEAQGSKPCVVVEDHPRLRSRQVDDPGQLLADAGDVGSDAILRQEFALVVATRRVPDPPGATSGEGDRSVTASL